MIIRTRFDVWAYHKANFRPFIEDTYENNRVNAITSTKRRSFPTLRQFNSSIKGAHNQWMVDQMIIHPRKILDKKYIERLHLEKKLHPAEMGWYQVLSYKKNQHRSFDGWVNHDKNINTRFFYKNIFEIIKLRPTALFIILKEEVNIKLAIIYNTLKNYIKK